MSIELALFQPDIAGNTGAILRLCACLDVKLNIIEPAGFDISDKNLRRAAMDYIEIAQLQRHINWDEFCNYAKIHNKRIVLFTTKVKNSYYDFAFSKNDILLFGRESAGVPPYVHDYVHEKVTILMNKNARSINLALSAAMALAVAQKNYKLL